MSGARARAQAGDLLFGTIDSWLIWKLTGGQNHLTDVSNAARTMLMDVHRNAWDPELLDRLDVPARMMPRILPSSADFGATDPDLLGRAVPICGVAGDHRAHCSARRASAPAWPRVPMARAASC